MQSGTFVIHCQNSTSISCTAHIVLLLLIVYSPHSSYPRKSRTINSVILEFGSSSFPVIERWKCRTFLLRRFFIVFTALIIRSSLDTKNIYSLALTFTEGASSSRLYNLRATTFILLFLQCLLFLFSAPAIFLIQRFVSLRFFFHYLPDNFYHFASHSHSKSTQHRKRCANRFSAKLLGFFSLSIEPSPNHSS